MKPSKLIRLAAKHVAEHDELSCIAIGTVAERQRDPVPHGGLRYEYRDLFAHPNLCDSPFARILWLDHSALADDWAATEEELQNWRVIALLFYSEMLKSEAKT